ncbi:MAG TPA: phosphate signaling complex protein PhoU [Bradyrhizobium sp.]|nr:phosphate signaling complex protein PhoU [Bradyrhizobium sp.]
MDHTVRTFDADLSELARKVVQMGRSVKQQIENATAAVRRHDAALAEQVAAADSGVDAQQREIEGLAVTIIARRQPVAVDLRELVGVMRMAGDLERIGDYAKNVAKRVAALNNNFRIDAVMPQLELMVQQVLHQLDSVLESYERRDVNKALEVWRRDQDIDALNSSLFRTLLTHMMEDPRSISSCTHLLFCAKHIERIGDHITNIAEAIYYIVEGHEVEEERPKADTISKDMVRSA